MHSLEIADEPKVKTAAKLFRELIYKNKGQLLAGIICAGYDKYEGGQVRAVIYSCDGGRWKAAPARSM